MDTTQQTSLQIQDLQALKQLIATNERFLFLAPRNYDADTIGTNLAFMMYLEEQCHKKCIMYAPNAIPEKYSTMPGFERFVTDFQARDVDVIFSSDTGSVDLFGTNTCEREVMSRGLPWINLDHHSSNGCFGTLNLIDTTGASCSMLLQNIFNFLGAHITPDMATLMLLSIYYDTGCLVHPNTTKEVYEEVGLLVKKGGNVQSVLHDVFLSSSLGKLKIIGRVFERASMGDGALMSGVTFDDLLECGANRSELDQVVNIMNTVADKSYCVLLSEDGKGNVKGGLRTQETSVDVSKIAQHFGGGGHKMAAGFTVPGKLEMQMQWRIIPANPVAVV